MGSAACSTALCMVSEGSRNVRVGASARARPHYESGAYPGPSLRPSGNTRSSFPSSRTSRERASVTRVSGHRRSGPTGDIHPTPATARGTALSNPPQRYGDTGSRESWFVYQVQWHPTEGSLSPPGPLPPPSFASAHAHTYARLAAQPHRSPAQLDWHPTHPSSPPWPGKRLLNWEVLHDSLDLWVPVSVSASFQDRTIP